MLEAELVAEPRDRRADALHRHTGPAQRAQDERLGEADERHGCAATGARKHREQRLGILRTSPVVQRRGGHLEVARGLAQRERARSTRGSSGSRRASAIAEEARQRS